MALHNYTAWVCGCRCGLGAEKSFSFLRERVDPRLHTYLADEVRETVLVVNRYVRDCLKPSGQVAFHPSRAELRAPDNIPCGTLTPAKSTAVLQKYSEAYVDTKHCNSKHVERSVRISKRPNRRNSLRMREQCVPGALFSPHPLRLGTRLGTGVLAI